MRYLAMTGILAICAACSHNGASAKLDQELASEPPVSGTAELRREAKDLIEAIPGISDEQRAKLLEVRANARASGDKLRAESLKLRSLLLKELASPAYDQDQVDAIKSRLKWTEADRLSVIFKAVDEANAILGREVAKSHPEIFRDILDRTDRI